MHHVDHVIKLLQGIGVLVNGFLNTCLTLRSFFQGKVDDESNGDRDTNMYLPILTPLFTVHSHVPLNQIVAIGLRTVPYTNRNSDDIDCL